MNWLEVLGTVTGLVYLWLEYRANAWLWVASVIMPAIYIKVYYDAGLYADLGISIYYIVASVYGLWYWLRTRRDGDTGAERVRIARIPRRYYGRLMAVAALVFVAIGFVLSEFTDSNVPWADAFTTALSVVAMWLLARKYLEQWLVWIAANVACAALYVYKDLWFTAGLYLAYAAIAVMGYRAWKRLMVSEMNKE